MRREFRDGWRVRRAAGVRALATPIPPALIPVPIALLGTCSSVAAESCDERMCWCCEELYQMLWDWRC